MFRVSNITIENLTTEQVVKYDKLKNSGNFSEIWFIDIADIEKIPVIEQISVVLPDRDYICTEGVFS